MRSTRLHKLQKRLVQITTLAGLGLVLLFWKIDYVYEVVLFHHVAHSASGPVEASSRAESEAALFHLTTHQISRNLYIKNEKSPLTFLLNGFALCDQQAKVLSRLLYYLDIPSRAVPLFFDTGKSNHTILEWFDGNTWVISDPFLHLPINIAAPEFCQLDTHAAHSDAQVTLIHRAHRYYASNQGLLQELKETYARPNLAVWEFFRGKPEIRWLESILSSPLKVGSDGYLDLLNKAYRFRHYRSDPLMNRYIEARHQELMGQCAAALRGYRSLLPHVKGGGRPKDLHFELDQEMLKWRIVANRWHCAEDHPSKSFNNRTSP